MFEEKKLKNFGELIGKLINKKKLSRNESYLAYKQIILNHQPELQQGAFLSAHISNEPTIEEIAGAWDAIYEFDTKKINIKNNEPVCDIVGTGSDSLKTINCSTPASFIAAACGLKIAKKGARLVTGVSGASVTMELLGIDLNSSLDKAEKSLNENDLCYLPGEAFLKGGWGRLIQSMRFTSIFNIVGPLTKPCEKTNKIVIGTYNPKICEQVISILKEIKIEAALSPFGLVEGKDENLGMDEFSVSGPTKVVELKNGKIEKYIVTPSDFGLKNIPFSKISSKKTAVENANIIKKVLYEEYDSPEADFFCVNSAAALYISGIVDDYKKGFEVSKQALANGKAKEKLLKLIEYQG